MEKRVWGKTKDGADVTVYTIGNANGMTVEVMDFGADLLSIKVPTKDGKVDAKDIVDIVSHTMGKPTSTEKFNEMAADINEDGVVNIADVVKIANIIMEK